MKICCRFLYVESSVIKLRQNKRIDKFAGKSTWHIFRERVRVLEVVATTKISIFGEFIDIN